MRTESGPSVVKKVNTSNKQNFKEETIEQIHKFLIHDLTNREIKVIIEKKRRIEVT